MTDKPLMEEVIEVLEMVNNWEYNHPIDTQSAAQDLLTRIENERPTYSRDVESIDVLSEEEQDAILQSTLNTWGRV